MRRTRGGEVPAGHGPLEADQFGHVAQPAAVPDVDAVGGQAQGVERGAGLRGEVLPPVELGVDGGAERPERLVGPVQECVERGDEDMGQSGFPGGVGLPGRCGRGTSGVFAAVRVRGRRCGENPGGRDDGGRG